jgi:carboxyl-terminal processing protease
MFSNIEGNFVGLGIELKAQKDCLQILSVISKGPAEEAGIRAGERIVRVESSRTDQVDTDYVADLLRGVENTYVSLSIVGVDGNQRDLRVQRRRVEVPCVENIHFVDVENHVGYLRLTNFQKTTTRDVERALWDLHRQGMRSLIIDVRGNPGGLLSAAVEVADRFLGNGRIVTTRGRNVRENFDYMAHRANTWNVPLAVLVDHDSASASEIFAGAIADSGRGVLVGETSYGKGSVQGIFRMQSAKFGLCLTTAKFFSPSGRAISQNGVVPTIEVEPTYIAARPDSEGKMTLDRDDAVMQKAIEQFIIGDKISRRP